MTPHATASARTWVGFTVMCLGLFMAILDIQIVAAALPKIADALHTPLDRLSWVQTTYLITEVIAIAMSGRLARAMSTRWLFSAAALGFVLTSLGCALSTDFAVLIVFRTLQGFFAGTLIPTVFAAGYKMFSKAVQPRAILIAGVVAMLAPSIGPYIGGYIAQKLDWNWLFYINVPIGLVVAVVVARIVRIDEAERGAWRSVDVPGFVALAVGLASLQIVLKVGPEDHWVALRDYGLLVVMLGTLAVFVRRCLVRGEPLVDLAPLRHRGFAIACAYNLVLGVGLFGSLYVLPLFLGFVRHYSPLEIGEIMTVMGVSQLLAAPLATIADRRLPAPFTVLIGFGLFAAGAFANAHETPSTDFGGLVVPQVLRGAALLFCILPITNVALDELPAEELSNASGLLNFMRNIGGAIGIGLVDTIVNLRPAPIAAHITNELLAGNATVATYVGIPVDLLKGQSVAHADPDFVTFITPIIARAAATDAFNEAWLLIGGVLAVSLLLAPFLRRDAAAATSVRAGETPLERLADELPYAVQ